MERAPDDENLPPKRPVGFDPQETLTERDKTRNVQNGVGIQIVKLNPVGEKKPTEERMRGKRKPPEEKGEEEYPEVCRWPGNDLGSGEENFRRIILQDADLVGALQFLLQELGLDPITHGGRVGVSGLGFLRGGAGGGGAPLAHGVDAQREWKERCEAMVGR
jgi:hypothetical protein